MPLWGDGIIDRPAMDIALNMEYLLKFHQNRS